MLSLLVMNKKHKIHEGGGWEKIAGGRKSNVSDKTLCFFEGWQNLPLFFIQSEDSFWTFSHQLACNILIYAIPTKYHKSPCTKTIALMRYNTEFGHHIAIRIGVNRRCPEDRSDSGVTYSLTGAYAIRHGLPS